MNKTRRSIGVTVFVLAVLGTAWAYERTHGIPGANGGPAGVVTAPAAPAPPDAPATDSVQDYDRSDLFLTQG